MAPFELREAPMNWDPPFERHSLEISCMNFGRPMLDSQGLVEGQQVANSVPLVGLKVLGVITMAELHGPWVSESALPCRS